VLTFVTTLLAYTATAQTTNEKPADYVLFKNGDKLTGTLVRGVGNDVIFKSDILGEVTVPMNKIQELFSHGSFVIIKSQERITRTTKQPGVMTFSDGKVTVNDLKTGPETIAVKDIGYVIDQATYVQEVTSNPGPFQRWKGSLTGGLSVLQATSYGQTFNAGVNLIRAIPTVPYLPPRTRTTFNLLQTYGKLTQPVIPQTVPPSPDSIAKTNIFHSDFEHDKYVSGRFYVLGNIIYDHNYAQGLDLAQLYGVGVGYTVIKTAIQQLDFKGDIHYQRQNFTQYPPPAISTPNQDLIGSTFAEAYKRTLPGRIALTQSVDYIQSWNNLHAYSAAASLGIVFPVYRRFGFNLNLLNTYLNNPAFGYQKNSLQFLTGVTYTLP